jgi:putative membrane protein
MLPLVIPSKWHAFVRSIALNLKPKQMKTILVKLNLLIALGLGIIACNEAKKESDDPKDIAEEHNDAKFNKAKEKDAQFLVDAAEMSLTEIKLAELAEKDGTNNNVKELGKMMKEEHQKSLQKLKELAEKKMITIPTEVTENGQDSYNKLLDKKNNDFDNAYCEKNIDMHKDAIDKFEKCSNECEDHEIKTWAKDQLTTLRTHLDKSMDCRDHKMVKDDKMVKDEKNAPKKEDKSTSSKEEKK